MTALRTVRRRFPDYGWAWPKGDLDLLLKAVMVADEKPALEVGLSWLARHDMDGVQFREQRLLAALSERFGKRLSENPAHPRLMGLQRLLWSRSRMALRDTANALKSFHDAGIPFMLIKGASRIALDPGAQRGRISHDIDVLLSEADIRSAYSLLLDAGWEATNGAGPERLKEFAGVWRAINFIKGDFGDLDVHRVAYHPAQACPEDDRGLWDRSVEGNLEGIPARVPAASDRIALAIAHGALDAHTHSDWLCDIDSCIRTGGVEWADLLATLKRRRVLVPAASALTYLSQEIGTPLPEAFLSELLSEANRAGLANRLVLIECKPKSDLDPVSALLRGLVKQARLWRGRRGWTKTREVVSYARRSLAGQASGPLALRDTFILPRISKTEALIRIVIDVELPSARRRIDWELSGGTQHLAVLRYRKLLSKAARHRLSFLVKIPRYEDEDPAFSIQARPSRLLRNLTNPIEIERYGPIPFRIASVSMIDNSRNE